MLINNRCSFFDVARDLIPYYPCPSRVVSGDAAEARAKSQLGREESDGSAAAVNRAALNASHAATNGSG